MYIGKPIKEYLDDLAAKKPAPGGGSAAALAGSLGVGLLSMVCNFTLGKKKYKDFEADVSNILSRAEVLREKLTKLVDEDVEAYKKFTSSDKGENAVREVLSVPLEICNLTTEALELCPQLVEKGNTMLISDVGCAAELLEGAFHAAFFNVEINLVSMKAETFIVETRKHIIAERKKMLDIKDTVCKAVTEKMGGE